MPSLDAPTQALRLARLAADRLVARNAVSVAFFAGESERLARACQEMAARFLRGGRLLAFGRGHYATDAQHVAVEFVHPVIVGKRALPALDLSLCFRAWLTAILRPDDMVMGFGPPGGDREVADALAWARSRGAQTFALAGPDGRRDGEAEAARREGKGADEASYAFAPPSADPYIHQEIVEILYHTLWETVHVFFEHREMGHEVGASGFLYPFLERRKQDTGQVTAEVAASIRGKVDEDVRLRQEVAQGQAERLAEAAVALRGRLQAGGKLIFFGNGGSATDANDWALDCAVPLKSFPPMPALSLALEPASITAVANDIGSEAIFLRQLIAHARPEDVAVAISTSGGSANVIAALGEARKRGLMTLGLLGYGGGEIVRRGLADFVLVVPCDYIPRIQEIQASTYHVLLELIAAAGEPSRGVLSGFGEEGDPQAARPGPAVPSPATLHARDPRHEIACGPPSPPKPDSTPGGDQRATENRRSEERRREVERPMEEPLELFGGSGCPYTSELREQLLWEGREFVEHDVESDSLAFARLLELTGGRQSVPVLVAAGRVAQVGWQGRTCAVSGPEDDSAADRPGSAGSGPPVPGGMGAGRKSDA